MLQTLHYTYTLWFKHHTNPSALYFYVLWYGNQNHVLSKTVKIQLSKTTQYKLPSTNPLSAGGDNFQSHILKSGWSEKKRMA